MGHAPDWCRQNFKKTQRMADGGTAVAAAPAAPAAPVGRATPNLTKGMDALPAINLGPTKPPEVKPPPPPPPAPAPAPAPTRVNSLAALFGYPYYGGGGIVFPKN